MAPPLSSDEFGVQTLTLIPGLPNDVGALILAFVPYCHHARLKVTCKSWRRFFSSKALISLRQNYVVAPKLLCIFPQDPSISPPYLFDPKNMWWCPLPLMPCNPHVYGLTNFISVAVGPHLYVLGGSLFDTRSFPLDRPSPSSSVYRFDFAALSWESVSPMITPRGSFACAAVPERGKILVAGGGSRHTMFGAAGSRMSSVEMYDIGNDEWVALDGLPRFRAGCVGFYIGREFWVMGGYGESRTGKGGGWGRFFGVDTCVPKKNNCNNAVVTWNDLTASCKIKRLSFLWNNTGQYLLQPLKTVSQITCCDLDGIFKF
ncbi:hypothetical protein SASPL_111164 [Salvia splendens]|uniref:F-box domain-containing protein n=1 Tax=Salvia splendens TaxID=180675 RepID=A0A8X8Y7J5_SALSN|nr:hypothetical protein SASPL_111164 [Salvia splendens]